MEKQNVSDVEQSSSTEQKATKPLVIIVQEVLQYFLEENLTPKEILMVLRELENEAITAYIIDKFDGD